MVSRDAVIASLETVNDPHVPVNLRRMGMLQDVAIAGDAVTVRITVPCLGCPAVETLRAQVQQAVSEVAGVQDVHVDTLWGSHWQRADVDPTAHPILRQYGLQI